jgi:oxygen-independent coproporphyrinogen-3 oxidase
LAKITSDPISSAFSEKFTIHPGQGGRMVSGDKIKELFDLLLSKTIASAAVYVHIPFCLNHCIYCGFAGKSPTGDIGKRYSLAIAEELRFLGKQKAAIGPVRTVYFGGGTPSCLDPEDLKKIVLALKDSFTLANDCEITLEGAVHDFSTEKIDGFLEAGFNRFSLGIQSFDTTVRKRLGRRSEKEVAIRNLTDLVKRDMGAVIIDLIYGLPGQSLSIFETDLKIADDLGLDGLDTYQLNVFPKGDLKKAVDNGKIDAPAPLHEQGRYYARAYDFLLNKHWKTLSLSHYARTSRERNFYNPWAKRRGDCFGVGAGAGGFIDGFAYYRLPNPEKYIEDAINHIYYPSFITDPSPTEVLSTFIVKELEVGSLNYSKLLSTFNLNQAALDKLFYNWKEAGLITLDDNWLNMTVSGRFWGVNLTQAIVETATNSLIE